MNLRRPSQRKPPTKYLGDGTYGEISDELAIATSKPNDEDNHSPSPSPSTESVKHSLRIPKHLQPRQDSAVGSTLQPQPTSSRDSSRSRAAEPHDPFEALDVYADKQTPSTGNMKNRKAPRKKTLDKHDCDSEYARPRRDRRRSCNPEIMVEHVDIGGDSDSPSTLREGRRLRGTTRNLSQKQDELERVIPSGKAAAFPTLESTMVPSVAGEEDPFNMLRMVDDRRVTNSEARRESLRRAEAVWDCTYFPQSLVATQKVWYTFVRTQLLVSRSADKFHDLWPPLRQIIIDAILASTNAFNTYTSALFPVCVLLSLTCDHLHGIIAENIAYDPTQDIYILRRRRNAEIARKKRRRQAKDLSSKEAQTQEQTKPVAKDAATVLVLDPDEPPPVELLKAVQFLREERLPGWLLGEWQVALLGLTMENVTQCQVKSHRHGLQHLPAVETLTDADADGDEVESKSLLVVLRAHVAFLRWLNTRTPVPGRGISMSTERKGLFDAVFRVNKIAGGMKPVEER